MQTVPVPSWLATRLAPGEQLRWHEAPGVAAWQRAAFSVALAAFLSFYVGYDSPRWWTYLLPRDMVRPAPWLAALAALVVFGAGAAQTVIRHAFTAYAVTDSRLIVVTLLGRGSVVAYPLRDVSIAERDRDKKRPRFRLQIKGKRRFRLRPNDTDGFAEALRAGGVA